MQNAIGAQRDEDEEEEEEEESLTNLMKQMDEELLLEANIASDRVASDSAVEIDFHMAKNLLDSYAEQHGLAGPLSNIIGELKDIQGSK